MPNNTSKTTIKINDASTLNKAHQILNTEIKIFDQDKKFYNYQYELVSDVNLLNYKKKKVKILKDFSIQLLKTPKKKFQSIKNFPRSYKILTYSFFLFLNLNLSSGLNKVSNGLKKVRSLSKSERIDKLHYSKKFYPKLLRISLAIDKIYSYILNQSFAISRYTGTSFYKKALILIHLLFRIDAKKYNKIPSYTFLKKCFSLDELLIKNLTYLEQTIEHNKTIFLQNEKLLSLKDKILSEFVIIKPLINYLTRLKNFVYSIEEKHIKEVLIRIWDVFRLYFIPFIFLSTQAFVPIMEEYEYIIVNPLANLFIGNVPFLPQLIKALRPITKNPMLLFWAPLAYLLVFPLNYKSLKIPYKFAFNGTVALVFLVINYSCVLLQFLLRIIFETNKIVKDIFFTSYLMKNVGKSKLKKDKDQVIKLFSNLVTRYDRNMQKSYYEFLLLIHHRFFSYLALISLAALLYNCTYYVIHNKNPKMIIITKAALGTIKNPQDDKE